jgi:hypothetical protein
MSVDALLVARRQSIRQIARQFARPRWLCLFCPTDGGKIVKKSRFWPLVVELDMRRIMFARV